MTPTLMSPTTSEVTEENCSNGVQVVMFSDDLSKMFSVNVLC